MPRSVVCVAFGLVVVFGFSASGRAQEEKVLLDTGLLMHKPGEVTLPNDSKAPAGTVEAVDGKLGKAAKFSFVESKSPQFFTAWVNPKDNWDEYEGFSFYVKGDGSKHCGGIELIDGDDYGLRFGYCFPIASTEWTKFTVPFRDLMPETSAPLVDAKKGYAPSKFRNFWVGKWFYWREFPACSFAIDRVMLEKKIDRDTTDYRPQQPGLARVLEKLKAKKPITIVTMGDSLTDTRHWSNREKVWPEILAKKLRDTYGSEVRIVNPAIGGTTLSQNVILIPRWLQDAPSPDLVLVWFGGNDWATGVRHARYGEYLREGIERIRRLTKGSADILVMSTCPGFASWETTNELCQAQLSVVQETKAGLADVATAFHKAGSAEEAMKREYWAWDKVHLGGPGHELTAETVFQAIQSAGLADIKAAPKALWMKNPVAAATTEDASNKPVELLSSFEPGGVDRVGTYGEKKIVPLHATDGKHALQLDSDGKEYQGIQITDREALGRFKQYVVLKVDVFNPYDKPVLCGARIDDATSKDYGSRFNDDTLWVAPGKSTVEWNLPGLRKSNARNFSERLPVDLGALKMVLFWIAPAGKPQTLFVDNVRLETSGLPEVEGLKAYDFGPAGAPVYPGFTECSQQVNYTADRGFGWLGADRGSYVYTPDALTGDCVCGKEFRVNLPNGIYEVNLCWNMFGLWGQTPIVAERSLSINGKEVLKEKRTGKEFLEQFFFAHEDVDDLPGEDLWEKFIAPYQKIHRFRAEVTDGLLRVEMKASDDRGRTLCFLTVYPEKSQSEGRKFMAALDEKRHERYKTGIVISCAPGSGETPQALPAEKACGAILYAAHTEDDIAVTAKPPKDFRGKSLSVAGAQGERVAAQAGLYLLAEVAGVKASVSDLVCASDKTAKILASAVHVRKVRHFLKRNAHGNEATILPYILLDFDTLALKPGVARGLWLTIDVPEKAVEGVYHGELSLGTGAQAVRLPIEVTVYPFTLDKLTDITMSATGSGSGSFNSLFPELNDRWWQIADQVMRNQAEHGMNAITGGPGASLKGVKDGKAEIDYRDMDRWMALAVKHGLTMPGDSYQGLDVSGLPSDHSKDGVAKCEAESKSRFGVSYEELLRLVYGDMQRHAKEKGWPKRVYYFLDEPRPEYGNIEAAAEMIRIRTRACPDTLFSGYYSTGQGRDVFFETMPVSISHIDKLSLELVAKGKKQIWDYSGTFVRHDVGRWAYVAARAGMKGFLRNGYLYVCSQPYFDFTEDEGSWSVAYPSKNGINDTVGWERTAQGVNDYRYLATLRRLLDSARKSDKAKSQAAAAEAWLDQALRPIAIADKESAKLAPAEYDAFRKSLAMYIQSLR